MQRRRRTAVGWPVGARSSVALTVVVGVVLAGCGGEDPDAVAIAEAGVEDLEAEPEPEVEPEPADGGGDAATEQEDDGAEEDGRTAEEDDGPAAPPSCDLATTTGDTELTGDAYEQVVLVTNFELELLAMDLAADLDELLSGVSDGPTLEEQLLDHQQRYVEVTSEVGDVQPPDGADDWHERAMQSFDAVCVAISDGLAGSADGDDERFEAFVDALTEFPNLLNQLHANAACGPFEDC